MAGSSRSELASIITEGPTFSTAYPNGQRGSYSGPSMERSGSFRNSLESRVSLSSTGVAKSPTPANPAEIPPLSNSLMLEPLSLADQKYTRYGELRAVLGFSLEEHPFGAIQSRPLPTVEEIKHFKVTMQEASTKARDRAKMLHDSIVKVDRLRNIVTRKRSRNEISSSEKAASMMKAGSQLHQNLSDPVAQRLEERSKNSVPNKRVRSSMSEGRGGVFLRQGTVIDKGKAIIDREKNMLRACSAGVNLADDKSRGLPAGGDGWDKNMKRKRSAGGLASRAMDPERETKQAMQPKFKNEARPRLSDGVGFRPGSSTSINAINKLDGSSQPNFGGSRSLPKNDLDGLPLSNDRREYSSSFEKERTMVKGTAKLNIREDPLVGSESPMTKGKASRAPRTGSTIANSSSALRTPGGIDGWEQSSSSNKNQAPAATNNRKRPLSAGPPPHVARWVRQRPQGIRMRRTKLVSPVSGHDESPTMIAGSPASDVAGRISSTDTTGSLIPKGTTGATHQLSMKLENIPSPAALSETEESGAAENKCKEKAINHGEDGASNLVKKSSTVILPTKKNKLFKEETGDGRRVGRNGRGLMQSKPSLSLTKESNPTKPMRNGRPSSDRSESKVGRPSKKVTDRKALTRLGHVSNSTNSELIVECEDDHEEVVAAANYVKNLSNQTSTLFWKTMSPYFAFVESDHAALLKEQITILEELDKGPCLDVNEKDGSVHHVASQERKVNCANNNGHGNPTGALHSVDVACKVGGEKFETDGWLERMIPLSQRLLAAIIPEFETDCNNNQQHTFSRFTSGNFCAVSHHADNFAKDREKKAQLDTEFPAQKNYSWDNSLCNGHATSNNLKDPVINNNSCTNGPLHAKCNLSCSEVGTNPEHGHNNVGKMQDLGTECVNPSPCAFQYEQMSLDEKILLELEIIGLQPKAVPDLSDGEDEQLDRDISKLKLELCQKARSKKTELIKLHEMVQNARMLEEKKIERLALDKLVEIAYRKILGGRGNHGSSGKSGVNKVSKLATLAFAKRTLSRYHKFATTGQSCFSEPSFRSILFSAPSSGSAKSDAVHPVVAHAKQHSSQPECHSLDASLNEGHVSTSHRADNNSGDLLQGFTPMRGHSLVKQEVILSKGKKREVLLDDVVGAPSRSTTNFGSSIPGGAKGKRSERERDHNKDASERSSVAKVGRPSIGSSRNDNKAKTKLRQKTAQISNTGILVSRNAETDATFPMVQEACDATSHGNTKGNERTISQNPSSAVRDLSKETEVDFSSLPLAVDSIEELGVGDELGGQVEDFWLNVDDDIMPDNDIMGLEIPMDDLTDLNMNF